MTSSRSSLAAEARTTRTAESRLRGARRRARSLVPALSLVGGLVLWELVGRFVVTNKLFFVPFSAVLGSIGSWIADGSLWLHLGVSAAEFALGFVLAAVVAIGLGLLMGTSGIAKQLLDPWVSALYATPLVALAPYFIILFGIYLAPKVALVFVVSIFPILINTFVGVRSTDDTFLEVGRSFSTPRLAVFYKILIPGALPFIVSGLRLGVGRGLTAVVVGEIFVPNAGIGYLISVASQTFNTANLFAGVAIFAVAGLILTELLQRAEAVLAPWRTTL